MGEAQRAWCWRIAGIGGSNLLRKMRLWEVGGQLDTSGVKAKGGRGGPASSLSALHRAPWYHDTCTHHHVCAPLLPPQRCKHFEIGGDKKNKSAMY